MMNAGCFSFEVFSCPEVQSVPVGFPDALTYAITVFTALIIPSILLIGYAEAQLNAGTTENGEAPELDSCGRIRCV